MGRGSILHLRDLWHGRKSLSWGRKVLAVAFAVCGEVVEALYVGLLGSECCVPSLHPAYAAGNGHVQTRPLSCA